MTGLRSRSLPRLVLYGAIALLLALPPARADQERVTRANYKQAMQFSRDYLRQFVYDTTVTPRWIGKTDTFWYAYRTSQGTNYYRVNSKLTTKEPLFDRLKLGTQLSEMVQKPLDPAQLPLSRVTVNDDGTKLKFVTDDFQYEYDLPAEKLTKLGKAPPAPAPPPGFQGSREDFERFQEQRRQFFERRERQDDDQQRDNQDQQNQQDGRPGARRPGDYKAYSPDRKVYLFVQKHNLYLAEDGKENDAVPLTRDGSEDYTFAGGGGRGFGDRFGGNTTTTTTAAAANEDRKTRPANVSWSSDSKHFYVTRSDSRGLKELFLVNSLATPRPTLEKYKYSMPGEDNIRKTELYLGSRADKKLTSVKPKWKDESYSNFHWGKTPDELRFVRRDRLLRHIEFCSLNVTNGDCKCLLAEGFENADVQFQPARYLDESSEMIWWSERSGWGHYYLYDRSGKFKNAITTGLFRASRIVDVDAKNRLLYFNGNGREPGENIYNQHLYCVHLDGTGLKLMDPGNASHDSSLSPSKQFVVDNHWRVDLAPSAVLRDADGRQLMEVEKTDLSRLYEIGWKMPQTFVVKAADGVTDLYGNMWQPFDFDPKKKYPVIAHVYPGPQTEGVDSRFSATSTNQQLAQLGFIVIQVGHRGGTPTRSKAYHRYGYNNLRDYALEDKKAAIEQLAARCPCIDLDRVGIYGHSGGGFLSAAALLQKPYNEFFKAAVASAGNHDNNIYEHTWAERYHGLKEVVLKKDDKKKDGQTATTTATGGAGSEEGPDPIDVKNGQAKKQEKKADQLQQKKEDKKVEEEIKFEIKVPTNAELAANLKGALLLVHGEIDNNVHPANTMRLVDALIKANKRFDMLILPGKRHGFGDYQPYFQQRMWDFFADHLLGDRQTGTDILDKR